MRSEPACGRRTRSSPVWAWPGRRGPRGFPRRAPGRVGVITSIGYCGFLGGPPLIGCLGKQTSIGHALLIVAVLMVLSVTIAGAAHRPTISAPAPATTAGRMAPAPEISQGDRYAAQHPLDRCL